MAPLVFQVDALCLGKTNLFMQEYHKPNKIKNKRKNSIRIYINTYTCRKKSAQENAKQYLFGGIQMVTNLIII